MLYTDYEETPISFRMEVMALPKALFKPEPVSTQVKRARRMITMLGTLNILLALGIVGVFFWYKTANDRLALRAADIQREAPITVTMPLKVFAENRILDTTDRVSSPLVTIFGKVGNYADLRNALKNFTVTVRDTTVAPNPSSGEFAENVVLHPGENSITVALGWDGAVRDRQTYAITYEEPAPIDASTTGAAVTP
jgi:hypothetical protein